MVIRSSILASVPGISHGFGTRSEPVPTEFLGQWEKLRPIGKQVHGSRSVEITSAAQEFGEADALYSFQRDLPIAVMTADCVPILLAKKDGSAVAAIHAGWKGTRSRIIIKLWEEFALRGEKPMDWLAAIGPAIGPCCYQVSEELSQDFKSFFKTYGAENFTRGERNLDLRAINELELKQMGIGGVEIVGGCTRCAVGLDGEPVFHSYRREGTGTRQWSVALSQSS